MANNINEMKSAVTASIVPTVTNATHRTLLNDEIIPSLVPRKDRLGVFSAISGAQTCNFSIFELVTATLSGNVTFSFSNLENGDVRHLFITSKSPTHTVSFSGATDETPARTYINTVATAVLYEIRNKNNTVFVKAINNTILIANILDMIASNTYKYVPPSEINDRLRRSHSNLTLSAAWGNASAWASRALKTLFGFTSTPIGGTGTENYYTPNITVVADLVANSSPGINPAVGTLPAGHAPNYIMRGVCWCVISGVNEMRAVTFATNGTIQVFGTFSTNDRIYLNNSFPMYL
jgi:hypothetical protein